MTLVARDSRGKLLLLKSALAEATSLEEAEIKALVWETEYAIVEDWRRIEWRSDT